MRNSLNLVSVGSKDLWLPGMDESMIFIPEEVEDLLCIFPETDATPEQEAAFLVNKASCELLAEQIEFDTYTDLLASVDIAPHFYVQRALWVLSNL